MTTLVAAAECVAIAGAAYAALFVIGWPVWVLVGGSRTTLSTAAGAPLLGLAVGQVVGWYGLARAPLGDLAWIVLVVGAVASAGLATSRKLWRSWPRGLVATWPVALTGGGAALSFVIQHRNVLAQGRLTTGEFVAADMVYYALDAQHLRDQGLVAGHFANNGMVQVTLHSTPGAYVLPAYLSRWTGLPMSQIALPVALTLVVLGALAARDLARVVVPGHEALAAIFAISAVSVALFAFSTAAYPLSQLSGQASVVAVVVLLVDAARRPERREVARVLIVAALAWTPLLLSYPHMSVLGAPVVAGAALGAAWDGAGRRRVAALVGVGVGAVAVLAATMPSRIVHAFNYALFLQDASAGFPVAGIGPLGLLGLQSSFPRQAPSSAVLVLGAAAVLVSVAAGLARAGRAIRWRAALAATCVAAPLASYALVYVIRGFSYQQWKWIAFFVPLFVVGALGLVTIAVLAERPDHGGHARRGRRTRPATVVGLALVALLGVQVGLAYNASHQIWFNIPNREGWYTLGPDLRTVASGPAYRGVGAVDLDLPDAWQNGWAAELLTPRRVTYQGASYFSTSEPLGAWTLERADQPGRHPPGAEDRVVNATYRLVRDTNRVAIGTLWVVGDCAGLYRFDGRRWVALERTAASGEHRLRVVANAEPAGTRTPLLTRSTDAPLAVDALQLEYLSGGRARIVLQHGVASYGGRAVASEGSTSGRRGPAFGLPVGQPVDLDAVFDPVTGEVQVSSGGARLLDTKVRFFEPTRGTTLVGRNVQTRYLQHGGSSTAAFTGVVQQLPTSTPLCARLRAAGRA
ncbi:MAG TPA: hypothetical protein VG057_16005 [Solirubrobacteraceae bacterium]|nr:hypothetical protein [Solirubrobacteraceae bacterium]